ncbi:amidase signature enzyme [Vararia minispora EC-137]|uniref:Amidase signature enzyme n=1 Tax=Vararia minispora EC-137 TaxID=1314806 RepID=A0ACB8QKU8_9AGAM|nr:amidase signature enzyme [Vararia minispora EC-137]
MFSYTLQRDCASAQARRQSKLNALAPLLDAPLTPSEERLHSMCLSRLVDSCNSGAVSRRDVLLAYGKKAFSAQSATNCLSDIMIGDLLPECSPSTSSSLNGDRQKSEFLDSHGDEYKRHDCRSPCRGSLAGVPVSIKDCIDVAGYPTTLGYSARATNVAKSSAAIVELLRDAGAMIHVKTTLPCGVLGLETTSALFGRTSNPRNAAYSPGASTGGGGALLACGGSVVEVGTDIGGSIRIPAAWCGVYSLKGSAGRFPCSGSHFSCPGLESLQAVASPMARSLEDLSAFWERVVQMRPWEYDHTCVPLPWRPADLPSRPLRFGVMWYDGLVPLAPAQKRALEIVVSALRAEGHEVVDFEAPTFGPLKTAFQLILGDGADAVYQPLQHVKSALAYFLPPLDAELALGFNRKTLTEERALIVEREHWKHVWHRRWRDVKLDFLLTAPTSVPGVPEGGQAVCGLTPATYSFLFNLLDLPAGVLPITEVSRELDALPHNFAATLETDAARNTFKVYDADKMHGLPVGVQVVGPRLEEERVLEAMKVVRDAVQCSNARAKLC